MDAYAEQAISDAQLVKLARERTARLEERAQRSRAIVTAILEALRLKRAERALFTASLSQRRDLVDVPTNEALPEAFVRTAPDKTLIRRALSAGAHVPGYELQYKADVTLTLRTT